MGGEVVEQQQAKPLTSADWDTAKPLTSADWDAAKPVAAHKTPDDGRTVMGDLADVGKGFLKRIADTGLELGAKAAFGPHLSTTNLYSRPEALAPTNLRQAQGMAGFDLASVAMPAASAATGSRLVPVAARALTNRAAFPQLKPDQVESMLKMGAGGVSEKSAQILARKAADTERVSSTVRKVGKNWVPISRKPGPYQPMADAMRDAVDTPTAPPSVADLMAISGRGAVGAYLTPGHPIIGGLIGAATRVSRYPKTSSHIGQALYRAAPALQGTAAGTAAGAARALMLQELMTRSGGER
jgi:hypothetical protein